MLSNSSYFILAFTLLISFSNISINAVGNSTTLHTEAEAQATINGAIEFYSEYLDLVKAQQWRSQQAGHSRKRTEQLDPQIQFRIFSNNLSIELKQYEYNGFDNENLKRQVQILSNLQTDGLSDKDFRKITELKKYMKGFAGMGGMCSYRDPTKCELSYLPGVVEIIVKTRTAREMSYYWNYWREQIEKSARQSFRDYIRLYRKAANLNGHITPTRTWYLYFDDPLYRDELEDAMKEFEPLYKEFHAYVRNALRKTYDRNLIDSHGTIPEYMIEQANLQAWRHHVTVGIPYPTKNLPNVKDEMIKQGFTAERIVQTGENFFQSLGLPDLPSSFWSEYAKIKPDLEAGVDCKSDIINLNPDIAFRYCPKVDFKKFLQIHGDMAQIQYLLHRNTLPFGLDREACPGFGNAIGEAAILAAGTPRHLQAISLIRNYTLDNELNINRLFRLGIHTIFSLRMYWVYEKFLTDALDHVIPPEDYNCGYWKIQEEVAGVKPPQQRTEENFDPGYKFYNGLDDIKSHTTKVISELLGYQILKALCIKSNTYVPGDPNFPMGNCDFYGSLEAGNALNEVMSMGSKKSWRDALELLTGERRISAKAILEFYKPLQDWLHEQNVMNQVESGWDLSYSCDKE